MSDRSGKEFCHAEKRFNAEQIFALLWQIGPLLSRSEDETMHTGERYPFGWRVLHWIIAVLVLSTIPMGLVMSARGAAGIFDLLTNSLYAAHKTIGFAILLLMIARIVTKLRFHTPAYPKSMPRGLVIAAKSLHHLLYVFLILTPLLGWAGVTAYPALTIAGGIGLPSMPFVPQDEALAEQIFAVHGIMALALGVLLIGHIGAALWHLVVRQDGVFQRMWFR